MSDADAAGKPDFGSSLRRGVEHFNAVQFWEAHEVWEEIWLAAESEVEQFLQGLIQLAAAYHHLRRGTLRGGVRLFDAALRRLADFPPHYCGLDRAEAEEAATRHRRWAVAMLERGGESESFSESDCPKLHLASGASLPPSDRW